jgi:pilus assembly protein CpaE
LAAMQPSIPIVAVHSSNDPDLILRCLRQGAGEFLFQPFTADALATALERLARITREANHHQRDMGKVYCFMPGQGASGTTTLACSLAFQLHRLNPQKKVLLADLDPLTGTISFLLKLKSNYSFVDAITHSQQMDDDLWKGLVTHLQGVDVILSPENPMDGIVEHQDASAMIEYSRENYGSVVLDTPGPYGDWGLTLAKLSDELMIVTTNELPALHSTQRALAYLDRNGVELSKIKLIVNRYNRDAGLDREAIEMALHTDVYHLLPTDPEGVQRSLLEGKPIPPGSNLGKGITDVADRLIGRRGQKKGSLLSGLFSLFDGASIF